MTTAPATQRAPASVAENLKRLETATYDLLVAAEALYGRTPAIAAAIAAVESAHFWPIPTRSGTDLYLLRCWLSTPRLAADAKPGHCPWESGDSTLLHVFARGDDDQALHDHPWDFETEILAGGYVEHLPPTGWQAMHVDQSGGVGHFEYHTTVDGPAWDAHQVPRHPGDRVKHTATDLHCVGALLAPVAVTLVRTGPRVRPWGFHPPGKPWVDADAFFAQKAGA